MKARRWWLLAIGGIALALLAGRALSAAYTDFRWYEAMGALPLWRARFATVTTLRLASGAVATAFIFANLWAVRRTVVSLRLPRRLANIEIAEEAARVVGLDVAGIDFLAPDITLPVRETGGAIVEVNAGPGFRMHTHPTEGYPRNVGRAVIEMLFPAGVAPPEDMYGLESSLLRASDRLALGPPSPLQRQVTRLDLFGALRYGVLNSRDYKSRMEDLYLTALEGGLELGLLDLRVAPRLGLERLGLLLALGRLAVGVGLRDELGLLLRRVEVHEVLGDNALVDDAVDFGEAVLGLDVPPPPCLAAFSATCAPLLTRALAGPYHRHRFARGRGPSNVRASGTVAARGGQCFRPGAHLLGIAPQGADIDRFAELAE